MRTEGPIPPRAPARRLAPALALALALAACSKPPPPPPPPTAVDLTLRAARSANPDAGGVPKPVRVRVLQLRAPQGFAEADFFALDGDAPKVLGRELAAAEELVLSPGTEQAWQAELEDGVRVIGVMAAYAAIDQAQWRAWREVPPNATTRLVAELGPKGVQIREAGP